MKKRFLVQALLFAILSLVPGILPASPGSKNPLIQVFYKEKQPSLKTLAKTKELLESYKDRYKFEYLLITDPKNSQIIKEIGLPETHFPFAVVINGKTTANIDGKPITFCEFPDFMHGIGRHEGNWSIESLKKVLADNSLLASKNILPKIGHGHDHHHECEDGGHYHEGDHEHSHQVDKNDGDEPHHKSQNDFECDGDCRNCELKNDCPKKQ